MYLRGTSNQAIHWAAWADGPDSLQDVSVNTDVSDSCRSNRIRVALLLEACIEFHLSTERFLQTSSFDRFGNAVGARLGGKWGRKHRFQQCRPDR